MANQLLREGMWTSERLARCPLEVHLAFPYLLPLADHHGRFDYDVRALWTKSLAYRGDVPLKKFQGWLDCMERELLFARYEAGGKQYAAWLNFRGIPASKRYPSRLPAPHFDNSKPNLPKNFRPPEHRTPTPSAAGTTTGTSTGTGRSAGTNDSSDTYDSEGRNGTDFSDPPGPPPPCPKCDSSDASRWDPADGTWLCSFEEGGCGKRFRADDPALQPKLETPAQTKRRRNDELAQIVARAENPPKPRGGYVGRALDIWAELKGGVVKPGRMGSALKPLVTKTRKDKGFITDADAWAWLEPQFRAYLETTDDTYCSPEAFAKAPRAGTSQGAAKARARDDAMRAGIEGGLRGK